MILRMVYKSGQIFLPFCRNSRVWETDGRTDRPLDRVCIPCSAVKMHSVITSSLSSTEHSWERKLETRIEVELDKNVTKDVREMNSRDES